MTLKNIISGNRTFLMGLAMISVVLFHNPISYIPGLTTVFCRFGHWGVDIFLFLSGFGCTYSLLKDDENTTNKIMKFYQRRCGRLLPTCILVGIVVYLLDMYFDCENKQVPLFIRAISLHQWYIQASILAYIMTPFIYYTLKKYHEIALIVLCGCFYILSVVCPPFENHDWLKLNWILYRTPVFIFGMYIAIHDLKLTHIYISCDNFILIINVDIEADY